VDHGKLKLGLCSLLLFDAWLRADASRRHPSYIIGHTGCIFGWNSYRSSYLLSEYSEVQALEGSAASRNSSRAAFIVTSV